MKAYVVFSSREPLLVVTRQAIYCSEVLSRLRRVGYSKFIAREVPIEHVHQQYGRRFEIVESALHEGDDLRVLDYSGERVFRSLPFSDYGPPFRHESPVANKKNLYAKQPPPPATREESAVSAASKQAENSP